MVSRNERYCKKIEQQCKELSSEAMSLNRLLIADREHKELMKIVEQMEKETMKNKVKIYACIEDGKTVFEGTVNEIAKRFNVKDNTLIYRLAKDGYKLHHKYELKFKGYFEFIVEIENINTHEKFVGNSKQVADKLLLNESYVVRVAKSRREIIKRMESENRRELALMQVEKARRHLELVFELLYRDDELEEIEDYYGTIDAHLDDLKHEIEWLEEYKPLSGEIEFEGEDPMDREIDDFILEKLERGE